LRFLSVAERFVQSVLQKIEHTFIIIVIIIIPACGSKICWHHGGVRFQ